MNKHLNITALILAGLAVFGLVKGSAVIFIGLLLLSGSIFGGAQMRSLIENNSSVKDIRKSNKKLAVLGLIFAGLSMVPEPITALLSSFLFGICFGLIGVNFIFERIRA